MNVVGAGFPDERLGVFRTPHSCQVNLFSGRSSPVWIATVGKLGRRGIAAPPGTVSVVAAWFASPKFSLIG